MAEIVRLDQVTPEWLAQLLGEPVTHVTAAPLGTGQVGATYRLTLRGGPTRSLVAKFAATDETSRATAVAQDSYARETGFYADLAPGKHLPVPDVLHVAFDPATHDFALIMREITGARAGDQLVPLKRAEAEAAVKALAKIHAAWWKDDTLDQRDWLPGSAVRPHAPIDPLYAMLWPGFLDRYAARVTAPMRQVGDAYLGRVDAWIATAGAKTLVHGDYRHDNLLFDATDAVTIVDWQTCALGRGVRDLAYFTGTSLASEDRRNWEASLFDRWHGSVPAIDRLDEWRGYRREAFAGFLMAVAAAMIVGRTDRGDAMFLTMGERAATMVLDHASVNMI